MNIKVGGSFIRNKKYLKNGIYFINDIIDKNGYFLTYEQFKNKYDNIANFLEYTSLISSIKEYIKRLKIDPDVQLLEPIMPLALSILLQSKKGCRPVYARLVHTNSTISSINKWSEELNIHLDIKTDKLFQIPFRINKDSMLQWFQTRIIHRILGTNYLLEKMKIIDNNLCSYCHKEPERLVHLFFNCPIVKCFWRNVESLINSSCMDITLTLSAKTVIFGCKTYSDVLNTIIVIAKYYIFKNREKSHILQINKFKYNIMKRYKTEKYTAVKNMNNESFNKKWEPFLN